MARLRFAPTATDLDRLKSILPGSAGTAGAELSRFARTRVAPAVQDLTGQMVNTANAELNSIGRGVREFRRPEAREQEIREGFVSPQEQQLIRQRTGAQITSQELSSNRQQLINDIRRGQQQQQAISDIGVSPEEQQQISQIEQGIQQAQAIMQRTLANPVSTLDDLANQLRQGTQQVAKLFQGDARITQLFGNVNPQLYQNITSGARHLGLDIAMPQGSNLNLPVGGNVRIGVDPRGFGAYVEVTAPDGTAYRFSHLSAISDVVREAAQAGGQLPAGTVFGQSGGRPGTPGSGNTTGAHLDISVKQKGRFVDPLKMETIKQSLL